MSDPQKKMPGGRSGGNLDRPSLLQGLDVENILSDNPERTSDIHTPWDISDGSLRSVPPFYPPIDANCTAQIFDATPSIVASRISACLGKRSIAVEYDDETNTATCMTVDRVHFNIRLFRGGPVRFDPETSTEIPDMSHAVLVECLRVRGDAMSFHWTCRAVLNAAMGNANGQDDRKPIRTAPAEFPRFERVFSNEGLLVDRPSLKRQALSATVVELTPEKKSFAGLEHAVTLLRKDRVEAQQLGIESIVCLTDTRSSGVPTAMMCAMAVLGSSQQKHSTHIHSIVFNLVEDCKLPNESADSVDSQDVSRESGFATQDDAHHAGVLRSLALRALANSLLVVSREDPSILNSRPFSRMTSPKFLMTLVQDVVGGSTRSPIAVVDTILASPHEAAMAALCLRVLIECCDNAKAQLQCEEKVVWEALEKAHGTGRHELLIREADRALQSLSGDQLMAK